MIKWIDIKEQKPPGRAVLIFCPDRHLKVMVAGYNPREEEGKQFKCEGHKNLFPTHWAHINYPRMDMDNRFKEDDDHIYYFDTFIMKDWVKMSKDDIYYMYDDQDGEKWIKVIWRRDLSALSDEFVFLEDCGYTRKGTGLTMDYGCMGKLIEKGELLTEEEYNNRDE
jgi:hypothetical protein